MQFSEIPQRDNVVNIEAGWFNVLKAAGIAILNKFQTIKNFEDVSSTEPIEGQALVFNGTEYEPRSIASNGLKIIGGNKFEYLSSVGVEQNETTSQIQLQKGPMPSFLYQSFSSPKDFDLDFLSFFARCNEDNTDLTGEIIVSLYSTVYNSSDWTYEPDTKIGDIGTFNVSDLKPFSEGYTEVILENSGLNILANTYYSIVIEVTQTDVLGPEANRVEFARNSDGTDPIELNNWLIRYSGDGITWTGFSGTLNFKAKSYNSINFSENFQIEKPGVQNSLNEISTSQSPFKFPDSNVVYISKLKNVSGDTAPTLNHAPIESVPSDAIVFARKDGEDLIICDTRFEPSEKKKLYSHGSSHDEVSSKSFSLPASETTEITNLIFDSGEILSARIEYIAVTATKVDRGDFEVIYDGTNWQLIEGFKKLDDSGIIFFVDSSTGQVSAETSAEAIELRYRVERL